MSMSEPIVIFDHVYKKFRRGEQHNTLRDFIADSVRKALPWGKKRVNPLALKTGQFWAVNDVSFKVNRGEALGIIGPNGSGKSTILKLLSGIITPDQGLYSVKGRLSALIEVGAGFHPDLTGRENVFLNCSILGMSRKETAKRFNQIVEFAGVEEFIDTPLKYYSSGMAVRLGFATSAFIEPEVLLVDEVLSVGDTEFRNRCANRMEKMMKNGVTMILVSHNLNEVRTLCQRTLMLFKGTVLMEGPTQRVLEKYHDTISKTIKDQQEKDEASVDAGGNGAAAAKKQAGAMSIKKIELLDPEGLPAETFYTGSNMTVRIHYHARKRVENPRVLVEMVWAAEDWTAATFGNYYDSVEFGAVEGDGYIDLKIEQILLEPNVYNLNIKIGDETALYDIVPRTRFLVSEQLPIPGVFGLPHHWSSGKTEPTQLARAESLEAVKV
jgi:lipopolysaccharide transport system ATP-binding protein